MTLADFPRELKTAAVLASELARLIARFTLLDRELATRQSGQALVSLRIAKADVDQVVDQLAMAQEDPT